MDRGNTAFPSDCACPDRVAPLYAVLHGAPPVGLCFLKTKLMQRYSCRTLHDLEDELQWRGVLAEPATVFTHQLELLLRLTQRFDQLRQHRTLWPQFALVNRWIPAWRYTAYLANSQDATDFLEAITQIMQWLEHNI